MKEEDTEFEEENKEDAPAEEDFDSSDEGFMQGYLDEEEAQECVECGGAVREEKKVVKEVDGETLFFCSANCAKEFDESMS